MYLGLLFLLSLSQQRFKMLISAGGAGQPLDKGEERIHHSFSPSLRVPDSFQPQNWGEHRALPLRQAAWERGQESFASHGHQDKLISRVPGGQSTAADREIKVSVFAIHGWVTPASWLDQAPLLTLAQLFASLPGQLPLSFARASSLRLCLLPHNPQPSLCVEVERLVCH